MIVSFPSWLLSPFCWNHPIDNSRLPFFFKLRLQILSIFFSIIDYSPSGLHNFFWFFIFKKDQLSKFYDTHLNSNVRWFNISLWINWGFLSAQYISSIMIILFIDKSTKINIIFVYYKVESLHFQLSATLLENIWHNNKIRLLKLSVIAILEGWKCRSMCNTYSYITRIHTYRLTDRDFLKVISKYFKFFEKFEQL